MPYCPECHKWFGEPRVISTCTCKECGKIMGFVWIDGQDKLVESICRECGKEKYGILPIIRKKEPPVEKEEK